MRRKEYVYLLAIGLIMAFRMLGLFMVLPVFAISTKHLLGASTVLIGVALGIYGLSQATLQIPLAMLSDHIGRKRVIAFGLVIFIGGSIVCALAHTMPMLILGRALQGMGAIGSTLLALVADLTADENRSKAMAIMGFSIGLAFTAALILGPLLNVWIKLTGIFWLTAILGGLGLILLYCLVPNPPQIVIHEDVEASFGKIRSILRNSQLLCLDAGIFLQHAILTAIFLALPIVLTHKLHLSQSDQGFFYLIVLVLAFFMAVPLIILGEKKRQLKKVFLGAIVLIASTQLMLVFFQYSTMAVILLLFLFFTAFTLLEATLPSLVSKIAPIRYKGTAMGIYSSSQFLGIFVGGVVGGWTLSNLHTIGVFMVCFVLAILWVLIALTLVEPPYLSTVIMPSDTPLQEQSKLGAYLSQIRGVAEVAFMPAENLMYVKIDKKVINQDELRQAIEKFIVTIPH